VNVPGEGGASNGVGAAHSHKESTAVVAVKQPHTGSLKRQSSAPSTSSAGSSSSHGSNGNGNGDKASADGGKPDGKAGDDKQWLNERMKRMFSHENLDPADKAKPSEPLTGQFPTSLAFVAGVSADSHRGPVF
jgi:hypothetical protein